MKRLVQASSITAASLALLILASPGCETKKSSTPEQKAAAGAADKAKEGAAKTGDAAKDATDAAKESTGTTGN